MDKTYADTVRLLLAVAPDVFANDIFAMNGGTAINLFVRDMPRLSVDIDVVYLPWQTPRDEALQAINQELAAIDDAELARLFFGIWLSPQTSEPALRSALLARSPGATAP